MVYLYSGFFLGGILFLYLSGEWVIGSLTRIARFFGLRKFVVAFLVMAAAAALPNLFVGISSALHGIPQLSFSEIVGGGLIDLTLAVALGAFFAKRERFSKIYDASQLTPAEARPRLFWAI